jgi:hypothetical protein
MATIADAEASNEGEVFEQEYLLSKIGLSVKINTS